MSTLSHDWLRHLLHYDPLTGIWTWINPQPRGGRKRGEIAGRIMDNGRRQLSIDSKFHYSARLAWFYMTGEWPKDQIDHINRIKSDDRWVNLREATQRQNSYNREWTETRGDMRGIRPHGNKYRVDIGAIYYGLFSTLEEATVVRDSALENYAGPFAVMPERKTS